VSLRQLRHRPRNYPRGEDTRQRILDSAIEIFAAEGYQGATTRSLAERAQVTLPAIQYYFGSKEGLYSAAVDYIVRQIEARLAPVAKEAAAVLASDNPSRRALLEQLYDILDDFALWVIGGENPESWGLFVTRAEIENSAVLGPLHQSIVRQIIRPCTALVGRLLDRDPEDVDIILRTATILGQILVFHKKCGKGMAHALGLVDDFSERRVHDIQALVRQQTAAILRAAKDAKG
jgi:TetR/AcrR family transcriptional regulator, regulator of cefoperazone and chloramphenicol sensitivity